MPPIAMIHRAAVGSTFNYSTQEQSHSINCKGATGRTKPAAQRDKARQARAGSSDARTCMHAHACHERRSRSRRDVSIPERISPDGSLYIAWSTSI